MDTSLSDISIHSALQKSSSNKSLSSSISVATGSSIVTFTDTEAVGENNLVNIELSNNDKSNRDSSTPNSTASVLNDLHNDLSDVNSSSILVHINGTANTADIALHENLSKETIYHPGTVQNENDTVPNNVNTDSDDFISDITAINPTLEPLSADPSASDFHVNGNDDTKAGSYVNDEIHHSQSNEVENDIVDSSSVVSDTKVNETETIDVVQDSLNSIISSVSVSCIFCILLY